jgi:hypothetical protein
MFARRRTAIGSVVLTVLGLFAAMVLTAGPAHAYDNERITATHEGVEVSATVDWVNRSDFVLRNVVLTDRKCDGEPVYFYASVPGFQFQKRFHHGGCNSSARWGALPGSLGGGSATLWLTGCVDKVWGHNCAQSRASVNPYW